MPLTIEASRFHRRQSLAAQSLFTPWSQFLTLGKPGLSPLKCAALTLGMWILCTGCEGPMPGTFSRMTGNYPAKPTDFNVEVLENIPSRPFEEIARIDVHTEHGFFDQPTLKQVMPELLKQARLAGADAIIKVQERRTVLNETKVLHVTATAIRYKNPN